MQDHKELQARFNTAHTGRKHTPEAKAKIREKRLAFHARGGQPWNKGLTKDVHPSVGLHNKGQFQSTADAYDRAFPTTSTSLECIVMIGLYERGIPFLFNVPLRHICRPDFMLPDAKIIVNVDGEYWHRDRKDKDANQDDACRAEGWLVFRWEQKLVRSDFHTLMASLENAYQTRLQEMSRV